MAKEREPPRSPRALRNEKQARITRIVLGVLIVAILGGAGWGATWLRKRREQAERDSRADPVLPQAASRPESAQSGPATSRTTRPSRAYRPDTTIADIRAKFEDGSVEGVWQASQALRAEAAAWRAEGAPDSEVNKLLAAVVDSETWILKTQPSFPELRKARGEVHWPDVMGDFEDFDTRFLTKAESARLARLIKQFDQVAEQNHGWIIRTEYESATGPLVQKALAGRQAFEAMLATSMGRKARELEIRELADLKALLPATRFRTFFQLPYVFLVEQHDRWDEEDPARDVGRVLLGLRRTFLEAFASPLSLTPGNYRPVSVVVFSSREAYHAYCVKRNVRDVLNTEAHVEPKSEPQTERLVVHGECALSTLLHEGTHQLVRSAINVPLTAYTESFWFHEGIAEWFAGSRQVANGTDGLPRFEIGLLMKNDVEKGQFLGPISILSSTPAEKRIPLKKLVGMMLSDRDLMAAQPKDGLQKIRLVYAQGWFLIYFLNHFAVDDAGVVQFGVPGTYRDVWLDYLKRELDGKSGEAAFLAALAYGKASLDTLERDMNAYLAFVARKITKGHVKDQKLVPWSSVPASASRPAATAADDRLR